MWYKNLLELVTVPFSIFELILSIPAEVEILRLSIRRSMPAIVISMNSIYAQLCSRTSGMLPGLSRVNTEVKNRLNTVGHSESGTEASSLFFSKILFVSRDGDISFQNFFGFDFSKERRSCE